MNTQVNVLCLDGGRIIMLVKALIKSLLFCSALQDFCLTFITNSQRLVATGIKLRKQNTSSDILHLYKNVWVFTLHVLLE